MPKSGADRQRKYRERKRAEVNKTKPRAKTVTERVREYRARKKTLRACNNDLTQSSDVQLQYLVVPSTSISVRSVIYHHNAYILDPNLPHNIQSYIIYKVMDYSGPLAANNSLPTSAHAQEHVLELNSDFITTYSGYHRNKSAHNEFNKKFKNNTFGHACSICDRLWFKDDLRTSIAEHEDIFKVILPDIDMDNVAICCTCKIALEKNNIPSMSTYNGFKYPIIPVHLPLLDIVSERLISPQIPFMQIRRLRQVHGQCIHGQIINVPISVKTMVNRLPRKIDDDLCINVHIKLEKTYTSSYLHSLVNKQTIKAWLQHLVNTPLYALYKITMDDAFFNADLSLEKISHDMSEDIPIEDSSTAQQQTLLWNDDNFLQIAPGENNVLQSLLFDEHAEELSFPAIYMGQFRTFKEAVRVTPFMIVTSELRRSDRRGVTPYHLLYMALKIMRLRIRDSLAAAFKHIGKNTNITRKHMESEGYVNNYIESNLAFLRSIPNSTWYWREQKRDLFAIMRQLGKPTLFLRLSANEIGWTDLLQILYKLKNNGSEISEEEISQLTFNEKSTLINEDAVTCAIYFNKLVNVIMNILQSKRCSPFGRYRVVNYWKHIEFQHSGGPHAHILLWLNNAPEDVLGKNYHDAIALIDYLISVSSSEASGNIKLQTHKHIFTCYQKIVTNRYKECRFEEPFMPCRFTTILSPMPKADPTFANYAQRYTSLRVNLENNDYPDIDTFYEANNITSDEEYLNILCTGITRPKVFYKRQPCEKWHNSFNPFLLNVFKSNIDIQFITEEYSCATYVMEYVNKTKQGISNLRRQIIQLMNENPEFDIIKITRKMSIDMLNNVEMTSQEAAWYLLREPLSKSSTVIVYIPTVWPIERQRILKTQKELDEMHCNDDSTDIWKENWFDKYEKRPENMENITLSQFVSKYTKSPQGIYIERKNPRIIRFRNYNVTMVHSEHKRVMVTLHIPFRNEIEEILVEMKFIKIYDEKEELILYRQKEFESNLDINKTIAICRELCGEDGVPDDEAEIQDITNRYPGPNPFRQ